MSIPKLRLPAQPSRQAEIITHRPRTLDFTQAVIVNREQLREAYAKARFASRRLHHVENIDELDAAALDDLCRSLHRATEVLGRMLHKEVAAR